MQDLGQLGLGTDQAAPDGADPDAAVAAGDVTDDRGPQVVDAGLPSDLLDGQERVEVVPEVQREQLRQVEATVRLPDDAAGAQPVEHPADHDLVRAQPGHQLRLRGRPDERHGPGHVDLVPVHPLQGAGERLDPVEACGQLHDVPRGRRDQHIGTLVQQSGQCGDVEGRQVGGQRHEPHRHTGPCPAGAGPDDERRTATTSARPIR